MHECIYIHQNFERRLVHVSLVIGRYELVREKAPKVLMSKNDRTKRAWISRDELPLPGKFPSTLMTGASCLPQINTKLHDDSRGH